MTIRKLLVIVRNCAISCEQIPADAGMGWPVPVLKNGILCASVPFFSASENSNVESRVYALTVSISQAEVAEYRNLAFEEETVGEQAETCLEAVNSVSMTDAEYLTNRERLVSLCDDYFMCLQNRVQSTPSWYAEFCSLFVQMIGTEHIRFYRILNYQFVADILNHEYHALIKDRPTCGSDGA